MTISSNQFSDMMKPFMNSEFIANAMKNPSFIDYSALADSIKKHTEILTNTNQKLNENIQLLTKKNAELMQAKTSEMMAAMKDAISTGDVKKVAESQNEYVKATIENSVHNAKEIIDLTAKASIEVFNIISQSMASAIGKNASANNSKPNTTK